MITVWQMCGTVSTSSVSRPDGDEHPLSVCTTGCAECCPKRSSNEYAHFVDICTTGSMVGSPLGVLTKFGPWFFGSDFWLWVDLEWSLQSLFAAQTPCIARTCKREFGSYNNVNAIIDDAHEAPTRCFTAEAARSCLCVGYYM